MAKASPGTPANRLAHETSPYLQQHAHNPVDWHPWGPEALELAKQQGKPILLSVGYSACHWCHVMAHESFEDENTARLMNSLFVNIKVDREERPDIDRIYQIAQQLITQKTGGWPLTMFLSHDDQRPFFGGTYFPKEPRYGMPPFGEILKRVAEYYSGHQAELRKQNADFMTAFAELVPPPPPSDMMLNAAPLKASREELGRRFDSNYGGFGGAPKFPHPKMLERAMRDWYATARTDKPDLQALFMATLTLTRMGEGGMYDQLAGGFCRYSVDSHWMIPHFEKMLYDNAGLLSVYAEATLATGDMFYAQIAAETAEWLIRDMQSPEGGYYSSLDADSEGHEGKFYVWDREAVRQALTAEEFSLFAPRFGLDRSPNFEGKFWHLHTHRTVEQVAGAVKTEVPHALRALLAARIKLLDIRENRVWPARDEKILTSWNAMTIRGMAIVARTLARDDLAESATRALDFIRKTLWKDGRLLATFKDGRAHLNAYLDDYVYLADAILELQQVRFRADELAFARELLDATLAHFEDTAGGGFFFTSDDHEALIQRLKAFGDDAIPSGNGVAVFVLQRMGHLLGEPRYLQAAERTLRAAFETMERYPNGNHTLLGGLEELLTPPGIVIIRGERKEVRELQKELAKVYAPHLIVLGVPAEATGLPPAIADKKAGKGTVAYVCKGSVCSPPIDNITDLAAHLRWN
ncbi:MAG: thioredoxin domain-containing protein [Gammaproteobacteria bacterium]